MAFLRWEHIVRNPRWRPYLLGCLMAVPFTLVMLQVWRHDGGLAWIWLFLYSAVGGFKVWWRTPRRKAISVGVLVGTFSALLIH